MLPTYHYLIIRESSSEGYPCFFQGFLNIETQCSQCVEDSSLIYACISFFGLWLKEPPHHIECKWIFFSIWSRNNKVICLHFLIHYNYWTQTTVGHNTDESTTFSLNNSSSSFFFFSFDFFSMFHLSNIFKTGSSSPTKLTSKQYNHS